MAVRYQQHPVAHSIDSIAQLLYSAYQNQQNRNLEEARLSEQRRQFNKQLDQQGDQFLESMQQENRQFQEELQFKGDVQDWSESHAEDQLDLDWFKAKNLADYYKAMMQQYDSQAAKQEQLDQANTILADMLTDQPAQPEMFTRTAPHPAAAAAEGDLHYNPAHGEYLKTNFWDALHGRMQTLPREDRGVLLAAALRSKVPGMYDMHKQQAAQQSTQDIWEHEMTPEFMEALMESPYGAEYSGVQGESTPRGKFAQYAQEQMRRESLSPFERQFEDRAAATKKNINQFFQEMLRGAMFGTDVDRAMVGGR